ncbi:MAG: DUF4149 domain-containing protein [Planctomycetota bacterium]
MQNFISGVVVGVIVLQTAVLAPTIFKSLEAGPAGVLLRAMFPKFFRLLAVLGVGSLVAVALSSDPSAGQYAVGGLTVVLPVVCAMLVPATNRATDRGDSATFTKLHTLSVVMTLAVLGANIAMPFV